MNSWEATNNLRFIEHKERKVLQQKWEKKIYSHFEPRCAVFRIEEEWRDVLCIEEPSDKTMDEIIAEARLLGMEEAAQVCERHADSAKGYSSFRIAAQHIRAWKYPERIGKSKTLIAAAPDLLEALRDFVAMGEQYEWDKAMTGRDLLMRNARAAIAKAEGQS